MHALIEARNPKGGFHQDFFFPSWSSFHIIFKETKEESLIAKNTNIC